MGVSVSKTNNKQDKPDAEYSQLHLSAVFNEAFVSGVFEQLPEYLTDLSALEDEAFGDSAVKKDSDDLCRLKKIMTILGPSSKEENDVDQWSIGGTAEKSLFASNNKKRVRLLLRIYQVKILLCSVLSVYTSISHINKYMCITTVSRYLLPFRRITIY